MLVYRAILFLFEENYWVFLSAEVGLIVRVRVRVRVRVSIRVIGEIGSHLLWMQLLPPWCL